MYIRFPLSGYLKEDSNLYARHAGFLVIADRRFRRTCRAESPISVLATINRFRSFSAIPCRLHLSCGVCASTASRTPTPISGAMFTRRRSPLIGGPAGDPRANRPTLWAQLTQEWTASTPLRIAEDRRQALVEIDALVALMLGVTADQLCTIYRTQFAVLYGYDHKDYVYDANGRLVPNEVLSVWRKKGDRITGAERTATNQAGHTYIYELPFRLLDREADMRTAYAEFERRLAAL